MLAGKMKLNHFLMIAGALGIGAIVLLVMTCDGSPDKDTAVAEAPKPKPVIKPNAPKPPPTPTPAPAPAAVPDGPSDRPVDSAVMQWKGKNLGSKKKKDTTQGKPYKVNVYQDAGKSTVNRAKVDLDRDDKWDEKWTFDGDTITRKVSPGDDDNYTEEYVWDGSAWKKR